jgi:hypothetical protein
VTDHPELDGYEPHPERPMRSRRSQRLIQFAAVVGIALLVMPLVISQARIAERSAQRWCGIWVDYEVSEPATPDARFEVFGPSVIGWECYATEVIGGDRYLGPLGIIPGAPNLRDGRVLTA